MFFIKKAMAKKKTLFVIKATVYSSNGRVLSVAFNDYKKTHTMQAHYAALVGSPKKIYLHAEIAALVKIRHKKGCTPYRIKIERFNNKGEPLNASPCPICLAAIKEAGIKYIEHTV